MLINHDNLDGLIADIGRAVNILQSAQGWVEMEEAVKKAGAILQVDLDLLEHIRDKAKNQNED